MGRITMVAATAATVVAFAATCVSSSSPGFPGTIQPPKYPPGKLSSSKEKDRSKIGGPKGSSSSDDEAGESSSDWDDALIMEEDPLAFVVDHLDASHSLSSDGENEIESENDANDMQEHREETPKITSDGVASGKPNSQEPAKVSDGSAAPPPPPPLPSKKETSERPKIRHDGTGESNISSQASQSSLNPRTKEQLSREEEEQEQQEQQQQQQQHDQKKDQKQQQQQQQQQHIDSTVSEATTADSRTPNSNRRRHSNDHDRHPSNKKPLQTLEKLQQLLDDTDYLTSSSSTPGTGMGVEDQQQLAFTQNQQQHAKSSVTRINSLWTSKDRTKYKKQQRLQKEQIRLKHQQEEQVQKRQQHEQQMQSFSFETEELSDTDDGLGYTLPNLPVYLSDGEEDTDEATYLTDQLSSARATTTESLSSALVSPSSSASRLSAVSQQQQHQQTEQQQQHPITFAQQQFLQQQRDLFFAQGQQHQQQQQHSPANELPYPNRQQQPPQQHSYYGAGAYPPPPPIGYYPYGPPPPQYYNGGPLPHPQYYQPSSYYPYRGVPRIETTVPRNPREVVSLSPSFGSAAANQQRESQLQRGEEKSLADQDSNKAVEGEGTGDETTTSPGGVIYSQSSFDASYYPQTPEQQEQWHRQQLSILQEQVKYERDLHRKHQIMLLETSLRSFASFTWKNLQSCRKISTCMALVAVYCYAAVSPRNLPYLEYNRMFYENLKKVALVVIPPLVGYGWLALDWNQLKLQFGGATPPITPPASLPAPASTALTNVEANTHGNNDGSQVIDGNFETANSAAKGGSLADALHALIHSFYSSFVFGYIWVFVLEIVLVTFLRLAIFLAWEPEMLGIKLPWSSTPLSGPLPPFLILPWALREYQLRPKRITLIAADILTSCIACPIVEEFVKLRLLQWTMPLSKNFSLVQKPSKNHKMKTIAEPITPAIDETGAGSLDGTVTNINPYIAGMLAVSLGIKWADAIRRVCMYTKVHDEQKSVYAFLRGIFPVQELCGIMTALGLARRDILGQKLPLWKLLLPATIVHSLANLRGMKPIFKWNSSTPWAEMQLSPDLFPGLFSQTALSAMEVTEIPTTKLEWFGRAFPKIMWVIILGRAAGYCAKNYFMINRQAMKRATTYAGKHAAFSAELKTAEKLKDIKDQYNE